MDYMSSSLNISDLSGGGCVNRFVCTVHISLMHQCKGQGVIEKHGSKIEFEPVSLFFLFDCVAAMNTSTSNVCLCVFVCVVMVLTSFVYSMWIVSKVDVLCFL
jgi:hypothetical protein